MSKAVINNEIILLRKGVEQAKVQLITKLTRDAKQLRQKKGTDEQKAKNLRKADRIAAEILAIKKVKKDEITIYALTNELSLKDVLEDTKSEPAKRMMTRIAYHKTFCKKIAEFKEKYPNYKEFLGPGRKKKQILERKEKLKESKLKKEEKNSEQAANVSNKTEGEKQEEVLDDDDISTSGTRVCVNTDDESSDDDENGDNSDNGESGDIGEYSMSEIALNNVIGNLKGSKDKDQELSDELDEGNYSLSEEALKNVINKNVSINESDDHDDNSDNDSCVSENDKSNVEDDDISDESQSESETDEDNSNTLPVKHTKSNNSKKNLNTVKEMKKQTIPAKKNTQLSVSKKDILKKDKQIENDGNVFPMEIDDEMNSDEENPNIVVTRTVDPFFVTTNDEPLMTIVQPNFNPDKIDADDNENKNFNKRPFSSDHNESGFRKRSKFDDDELRCNRRTRRQNERNRNSLGQDKDNSDYTDKKDFNQKQGFNGKKNFNNQNNFNDRRNFNNKNSFDNKRNFNNKNSFDDRRNFNNKNSFDNKRNFNNKNSFDDRKNFNNKNNFNKERDFTPRNNERQGFNNKQDFNSKQDYNKTKDYNNRDSNKEHNRFNDKNNVKSKPANSLPSKNATPQVLHPSWEAKKKQQEAMKMGFQGKKIVFDD